MARAAAIQLVSGPEPAANLATVDRLLAEAAAQGAQLAVLPEAFSCFGRPEHERATLAETPGNGPVQDFLQTAAVRHQLWIVGGTLPLRESAATVPRAACLVFDSNGRQVARFDKLHLFDVEAGDGQEYHESAHTAPGEQIVVLDSPIGRLGLAVCYDVRFPELFRAMAAQGMEVFALPSAFTAITGRAHWELLLRARAVENLCYGIAAAQGGQHANGRETFGDSLLVEPWGSVLARHATGPGVVVAEIDLPRLYELRHQFPVLDHRRSQLSVHM